MALDPLRFAIEIQDNASEALEGVKALLDKLRDTTINIQGGGDLKAIAASLEKIGGVSSGMSNNVEKATAALKREEEALLKLKDAAAAAYHETKRLENDRNGVSSDVNREREKLEVLRNSGDAAKKAADGFKEYSEYTKKAGEELSKIKTYSLNPVKSIEDSTKKSFAELRDYYRRMLYSFANSAGSSFLGDKDLLANAKANIAKYREELVRLRDESKSLFASTGDKDVATMTRSLERMISEYDKVIGKYDEMRAKAQEGVKYHDLDGQIKRQQETLQKRLQEETVANDQLTQQRQRQSQINQQIAQQEQKVAEAKERLAQATQKQQQGDQQTAQTLQKEGQSATETAGSLSKLLAEKKAVTDAENKLAQANARNIQSFTAEGGASQTAARQMSQLVALLNQISQITPPDLGKLAQSLSGISGVKINDASFIAMGNALGEAAAKIEAAKQSINGGRFGELANRIKEATASLILFTAAFEKFNMTVGKDQGLKDFMTGLGEVIRNVRTQLNSLEKASGGSAVMTDLRKSAERAKYEYYQLENLIKRANAAVNEGKQYGNTSAIERQIAAVKEYIGTLEQLKKLGSANGMTTSDFKLQGQYRIDVDTLKKMVAELERSNAENQKLKTTTSAAAQSVGQLTAEEQRLAQALNQTTEHARGQSQVLSDLKSMAMQYLGVWGGQQFLRNIIEIGGQLEMQRLSIGAILQNQSQANDLFERIKGLAVQSPFGVVELDQMTKQLTAYGFKYNELFDMTKRLADISAATGTGVDRLALALGHVRSEAALSGYTLRQFSMANVPLLQKLSEKLGKTTQEIRKMVRAKEVSYEDVIGVLKDITNEGGMFYNMQEVISSSVKAKFKNVKDAMDIMYGEMAEGYIGDSLKGVAEALMEVTRNWKDAATVLGTGAALWAAQRVAVMAYTAAIGKNTAATFSSIAANTEKQGAMLRLANQYRVLTTAERDLMNASRANSAMIRLRTMLGMNYTKAQGTYIAAQRTIITNTLTQSLSEGKLTVAELAHMVAVRKLTHEEARLIITNSTLNASLKEQALSIIGSVTQLGRLEIAFMRLGAVMRSIGSMALSFLPMAAITALIELWQHNKREMESAEEMANNIYEASKNATEATQRMMKETSIQKIDVNGSLAADNLQMPEFDKDTAESVMEQWTQYIREYAGTPNKLINDALASQADGVSSLADQYNKLGDAVKVVIEAQQKLGDFSDVFAAAQKGTDSGWFDDDVANDVKQYISTRKSLRQEIGKYYQENMKNVDRGIKKAREQDEAFRKSTEGMRSEAEMLIYLTENWGYYQDAIRAFGSETGENTDWIKRLGNNLRSQKYEMDVELRRYYAGLQQGLLASGENLDALSPSSQQMLIKGFKMFLDSLGNMSEQEYKERLDNFKKYFKITLDDAEENAQKTLTDWQRRAQDVFTVNSTIKVKSKTITDKDEFAQAVQKDLKEKQEYVDRNTKPIKQLFRIQPTIKFDTEYLGKYIKAISDQIFKLTNSGQNEAAGILMSRLNDELIPYYNALRSLEEDEKWLKQEGYPKSDKESKSKKNKSKSGSKKAYKDEEVEKWKKRVDSIKEAYSEYSKMEKEIGDAAAISEVKKMFDGVIDEKVLDDIKNYKKYIVEIQDLVRKRYESQKGNKKYDNGKQAEELLRRINKLVVNINMDELSRKSERWASGLGDQLEQLTRRWEIFNSVRDATGDRMLAEQLAGFGDGEKGLRNSAEAMKRQIESEIASMGSAPKIPIELDINASDSEIQDNIKNALGGTEYEDRIKGITDAVKKWRDAMRSVLREDIQGMGKLMGSVVSYAAQIKKIDDDLAKTKKQIANSGATDAQQRQMTSFAEAQADWKKMKLSADYSNLYNKTIAMSRTEFENAADAVQRMIDKLRDLGAMSPDEYLQEVDKLNKARMEWSTNGFLGERGAFGSFISGGNDGLMNYYAQRRDKALQNAEKTTDSEEKKKYNQEAEHYGKLFKRLSELSDAAKDVMTAFQTLQSGIELLGGLFDSLGMEGAANATSDAGGILGGALQGASSLSALGPYGMAAGAAVGLIGGIAQVHDKALERHINKLREDVRGIEANTEQIMRSRERTLGYDMGDVRRQMAQQYATPSYSGGGIMALIAAALSGSNQKKSMYEYYMQNSQGTGYEQEYANLVEQREKYMEILKDQQDKKKKSNEEIEETKAKIAELDDQIHYFSQDLAKELWGIDIKGWADQLSDALASAFENGENMAEAYREAVTSILQQMMQKMMQMSILEPMFKRLQSQLFGENGKGGVFDFDNPQSSMSKVTKIIGDFFGKGGEGEKAITASMEFMTAFQKGMQDAGLTVLNEASNTLSSGIQGTSEETSGLLAGYVNALRQDVSVNRILLTQYVTQLWPQYIEAYTAQVTSVSNIDNNVRVIMEMMQLGNGAMYEQIAAMRSRIDNIVLGIDSISIR